MDLGYLLGRAAAGFPEVWVSDDADTQVSSRLRGVDLRSRLPMSAPLHVVPDELAVPLFGRGATDHPAPEVV
jgi:hypothetical protein